MPERILKTAQDLTDAVDHLTETLASHRTRMRVIIGVVIFDILLTIGLVIGLTQVNGARNKAAAVQAGQYAQCVNGDTVRAAQIKLWSFVLARFPTSAETTAIAVQVHTIFAPRDCAKLR
jgi:hypothetical protein